MSTWLPWFVGACFALTCICAFLLCVLHLTHEPEAPRTSARPADRRTALELLLAFHRREPIGRPLPEAMRIRDYWARAALRNFGARKVAGYTAALDVQAAEQDTVVIEQVSA